MAAIGYARVSTIDQDLALQLDALAKAGCDRVFQDKASGAKADRPGLTAALSFVREGDILTVWKLDRLGRSLPHLIETVNALEARGVSFRSLTEAIDTTTPGGRLIFHIFGALGQFERDLSASELVPASVQRRRAVAKEGANPSSPKKSSGARGRLSPKASRFARLRLASRSARPCSTPRSLKRPRNLAKVCLDAFLSLRPFIGSANVLRNYSRQIWTASRG
jgi:DNA invertase Pin-like site-specific DNA recombinase